MNSLAVNHIVMAVANLRDAAGRIEDLLGRTPTGGGRHVESGTENLIVPVGDSYLELVTVIDPSQASGHPFGRLVASAISSGMVLAGWAVDRDLLTGDEQSEVERLHEAVALTRDGSAFMCYGVPSDLADTDLPFFVRREGEGGGSINTFTGSVGITALVLASPDDRIADFRLLPEGPTRIETVVGSCVRGAIVSFTATHVDGSSVVVGARNLVAPGISGSDGGRMERMVRDRRALHSIPEVGLDLPLTQEYLLNALEPLGLEIELGTGLSSITATLRGAAEAAADPGEPRPAVLIRSDMDALPVVEETGLKFASVNGAMHACGHDLHMAMLLECARELSARAEELRGDVIFVFQPGEENHGGARKMLDEGLLQRDDRSIVAVFGLHVLSYMLPSGVVAMKDGAIMAGSTIVRVTFTGRGGHGSAPHRTQDPLLAGAAFVPAVAAAMSHDMDMFEPAVLSFGAFNAGSSTNVIPDQAVLQGTLRTFSDEALERGSEILRRVAAGVAETHGVQAQVELQEICRPVENNADEVEIVAGVAEEFGIPFEHLKKPISVSEDFSYILQASRGAFVLLGSALPGTDPDTVPANHSSLAQFDESVLLPGTRLMSEWALRRLGATRA